MKMKRLARAVLICAALGMFHGTMACAGTYDSIDTSSPQKIMDGMASKATRGMANATTGWLELPKQVYITYKEDGRTKGLMVGPLKGLGMTLVRTLSGVAEFATFFLPYPGFYEPYFEPAYVWQKE